MVQSLKVTLKAVLNILIFDPFIYFCVKVLYYDLLYLLQSKNCNIMMCKFRVLNSQLCIRTVSLLPGTD